MKINIIKMIIKNIEIKIKQYNKNENKKYWNKNIKIKLNWKHKIILKNKINIKK